MTAARSAAIFGRMRERLNKQLRLSDGRVLGYAEYGDPEGEPVLYFHGWPGSRLEAQPLDTLCCRRKLRVVAIDRPGLGLSTFLPKRRILGWPNDVVQVADALGLSEFSVLGISGGGPYAAVCAALLPERVKRAVLVCGVAPLDDPGVLAGMTRGHRFLLRLAQRAPGLAVCAGSLFLRRSRSRDTVVFPASLEKRLPERDQCALSNLEFRNALLRSAREAVRAGEKGAALDGCLLGRPWGFSVAGIRVPTYLCHGDEDIIVPPAMGRYYRERIGDCRARFFPGEGHFSLPFNHAATILETAFCC